VAYKEKEIEKVYYSIGEVAELMGVNPSLLRYWESEFEDLNVRKSKGGGRLYTKADIEKLKIIYHLVKEKGFTIEGAKLQLKNNSKLADKQALVQSLKGIRAFLVKLREGL